jgi:hypothetical protein
MSTPCETPDDWVRAYALLALRVNRRVTGGGAGTVLIYRGPDAWREQAEREEPPPAGRLVDDADALLARLPFEPARARYLGAQVRALRAVAGRLAGDRQPLAAYARACLGIEAAPVAPEVFEEAHARLSRALPPGRGPLRERLRAWREAHTLARHRADRVPELVRRAVAETRRRTGALVPLPPDEVVECRLVSGVPYRAAGHHEGGSRSVLFLNADLPVNLADLLYVVAHEGHPGHIAEQVLKERELVERRGLLDHRVRFMLGPSFVLSEGLGLHAQDLIFPGDEAQAWLTDHVLAEEGIAPDGSDFAGIHRVQNMLWGAWANAAFLADEGRPEAEVAACLTRWALVSDDETAAALGALRAPGMGLYVLGYHHGWRLLLPWLSGPERAARVRRLLTEQLLPEDVTASAG